MDNNEQLAVQNQPKSNMALSNKGVVLTSFDELWRFSKAISVSGLAPKGIDKPESIMVAIQMGMEIGLSPMKALQNIAVINGKPSIFGDAAKGMVLASPNCEYVNESYTGEGDQMMAICKSKRRGGEEHTTTFSVSDAKQANLWNKNSVWQQYGKRMLMMRARAFNLRDNFADVLGGYSVYEEVSDYQPIVNGPSVEMKVDKVANTLKNTVKQITAQVTKPPLPLPNLEGDVVIRNNITGETKTISNAEAKEVLKATDEGVEDPRSDIELSKMSLDDLKGMCLDDGINFHLFEGKNTQKKLKTLIWEKHKGMPSSINLVPEVSSPEVAVAEAKEGAGSEGFQVPDLAENGFRTFPNMKKIYEYMEENMYSNDRIMTGIRASGLSYTSKEDLTKRAKSSEIEAVFNNC